MIGSKFGKPIMFFNRYCTNSIGHEFYKVAYGLLSFYNIKSMHWFHSIELFFKASTKLLLLLATWSSIKVMEQMMVLWILFLFYFTVVWYSFFSFWFIYIYIYMDWPKDIIPPFLILEALIQPFLHFILVVLPKFWSSPLPSP